MSTALDFTLAARRSEMHGLRALELTCELVAGVSLLVHALQRERGFSNIFLGSHEQRYRSGLDQLTADSVAMEQLMNDCFGRMDLDSSCGADKARLFNRIAYVLHCMEGFPELRRRIRAQELTPLESTQAFTRPIGGLLSVVFEAADTAVDPDITRNLVALFNFMQGKELAGQERATGVAGFSAGQFDTEQLERMNYLGEAQKRCFESFREYAAPELLKAWNSLCTDELVSEIGRLRQVASRSSGGAKIGGALGDLWFDLTSRRIDVMKQLEDLMTDQLQDLCREKTLQAQADLDNHRAMLGRLAGMATDTQPPATRLFNVQASDMDSLPPDSIGCQLNRSVLDVLHEQTLRLQELSVQLDEARRSLNERKLVDRAKRLLMLQHGLGEEEAYRMLQKAAMERSQRLPDVAQTLLNYADLLAGKTAKARP
ncbi:nitrate- and nitrite sensing domain-containing protein [uncultured Halopseudomonas sp.]|uniref:nitrate- and nitrite sensing domain-containing protein n=1 Tax=uncultured Halopseudomonas sp. TaxID=2901193 RepID=UPI0030ED5A14|tara:strand:+ start:7171 stop:8457 length:1287 start_codon:yes stop_codon:yes gene_type:complete